MISFTLLFKVVTGMADFKLLHGDWSARVNVTSDCRRCRCTTVFKKVATFNIDLYQVMRNEHFKMNLGQAVVFSYEKKEMK